MAREPKEHLDYFPLDTDFYMNRKVRRLLHSQGSKGLAVWIVVMAMIYGNKGYYILWDDNTCFDLSFSLGMSESATREIINYCMVIDLFDENQFEKNQILTSKGIQEQYEKIMKESRRKNKIEDKYRINKDNYSDYTVNNGINTEEIPINPVFMQQSKLNKNKQNKTKLNETATKSAPNADSVKNNTAENSASVSKNEQSQSSQSSFEADYGKVSTFYEENFGVVSAYLGEDLEHEVREMGADLVIKAMQIALEMGKAYSYAKGVLKNWRQNNIRTLADVEAEQVAFRRNNKKSYGKSSGRKKTEAVPEWFKKQKTTENQQQNQADNRRYSFDSAELDDLVSRFEKGSGEG